MATARPKSGVTEYTATTGSGPLTLTGAAPGFRGFVSTDDGLLYPYAIYQAGVAFETGIGTYTHGARTLARTTVLANINGTTVPLSLGAGTKEVSVVIPGERVAMLDTVNQFTQDQIFNGNRINLDDGNTWIDSEQDDNIRMYINSMQVLDILAVGGSTYAQLLAANDTAGEAPTLILRRSSASPANFDSLAAVYWQGVDSSLTLQLAAKIRAYWSSVTAGAHTAALEISTASNGALQTIMTMISNSVRLASGVSLFTGGKTISALNTVGAELHTAGKIVGVVDSDIAVFAYRNGTRGVHVACGFNGTYEGGLTNTGGVISIDGASLSHPSEWAPGNEAPECDEGFWVVCAAEGLRDDAALRHPLVRLSASPNESSVYGVTCGRLQTPRGNQLQIEATGSGRIRVKGPVDRGDLLVSSDTPGVAWRQVDDIIRGSTVAKATQSSPDDGKASRVVPCTLLAG